MDPNFEFNRDRFGGKYWAAPVRSFGKSSPAAAAAPGPKHKQPPLISPRGRVGPFSAASNASSTFSPVTPREAVAAHSAPISNAAVDSLGSYAQTSLQSPERELAHVALRCVSLSDQLSSAKEQLSESNARIESLERHLAFSKESMIEAVNSRDALAKQFQEYKDSAKKLAESNQRNSLVLKQQVQVQSESERAHNAQLARMTAQHQEALDILRAKLNAVVSTNATNHTRASELSEALAKTEAASSQELQLLKDRLAACEAAEHAVQIFVQEGGDFTSVLSKLLSLDAAVAAGGEGSTKAEFERNQLAARASAAVADIINQRDHLSRDCESLKLELESTEEKAARSRSQYDDFISELQRQLSACMSRECEAQARVAELSKELEETTSSSVDAISSSALDITTLRSKLDECESHRAALQHQLHAAEHELSEVHATLSQALQSDAQSSSATSLSSSIEAELRQMRAALKESMDKEARARSQIADCEHKLASSQAIEAASRSRVAELEAAAKLWDVFVQENARKSQASVQLQSLLAAKSALADQQEKEISSLRERCIEFEGNLVAAVSRLELLEANNTALQEQLTGTCFELDEVHATLAQVIDRESASLTQHASQELEWRKQIYDSEARLLESKAVEEAARSCVLELEAALKSNKESLSARLVELEKCKSQVLELELTVGDQCHELDSLKHHLADSEIAKISTSDELFTARSEVEVSMRTNSDLSAEAEALKSQLLDAQSQNASLAAELELSKAEAENSNSSLRDTSLRESFARRKELEASARSQALSEKLRRAETRVREMEVQLEAQTEFAASSAQVSAAMRDACNHSEILMVQMKRNLSAAASNEASARKVIAQLEAQLSGYENYFSQQMRDRCVMFGIGLFIVSMNVAPAGVSTPRSSPLTPGKKASAR